MFTIIITDENRCWDYIDTSV